MCLCCVSNVSEWLSGMMRVRVRNNNQEMSTGEKLDHYPGWKVYDAVLFNNHFLLSHTSHCNKAAWHLCIALYCVCSYDYTFLYYIESLALSRYRCMQTCIVTVVVSKVWVDIWFQGRYDCRKRVVDIQIQSKHRNRFVSFPYVSQVHRKYIS